MKRLYITYVYKPYIEKYLHNLIFWFYHEIAKPDDTFRIGYITAVRRFQNYGRNLYAFRDIDNNNREHYLQSNDVLGTEPPKDPPYHIQYVEFENRMRLYKHRKT